MYNLNTFNKSFSDDIVEAVWRKGKIVFGHNPNEYRIDSCHALIRKSEYGNIHSRYGWEIDHDLPKSKGGSDDLSNLQPLQWQNNRHKGDSYPLWYCKMRAV